MQGLCILLCGKTEAKRHYLAGDHVLAVVRLGESICCLDTAVVLRIVVSLQGIQLGSDNNSGSHQV